MNTNKVYTTEAALLKDVKDWLSIQKDIQTVRITDRFVKGIPDLLLCVNGRFVAIELKDDTGKVSPHQELFLRETNNKGGIGVVCRTLSQVIDIIRLIRNGREELIWTILTK